MGAQEELRKGQRKGSLGAQPRSQEGLRAMQKEHRRGSDGTAQEPGPQGAQDQEGPMGSPEWVQKGHMGAQPRSPQAQGPQEGPQGAQEGLISQF